MAEIGTKTGDTILFIANLYRFDPFLTSMAEVGTKMADTLVFIVNLNRCVSRINQRTINT